MLSLKARSTLQDKTNVDSDLTVWQLEQLPPAVQRVLNATQTCSPAQLALSDRSAEECLAGVNDYHKHVHANFLQFEMAAPTGRAAQWKKDFETTKESCQKMGVVSDSANNCAVATSAGLGAVGAAFFGEDDLDLKGALTMSSTILTAALGTFFPIAGLAAGLFQAFALDFFFPPGPDPMIKVLQDLATEILKIASDMMDTKIERAFLVHKLQDLKNSIKYVEEDLSILTSYREDLSQCGPSGTGDQCFKIQLHTGLWGHESSGHVSGVDVGEKCHFSGSGNRNDIRGNGEFECCLPSGQYTVQCTDSWGDGWHGGYVMVNGQEICKTFTSGRSKTETITVAPPCAPGLKARYEMHLVELFANLRESATKIFTHSPSDDEWYVMVLPMASRFAAVQASTILEMCDSHALGPKRGKAAYGRHWEDYFGNGHQPNWKSWQGDALAAVRRQINDQVGGCSHSFATPQVISDQCWEGGGKGGTSSTCNTGNKCVMNHDVCMSSTLYGTVKIKEEARCEVATWQTSCTCNTLASWRIEPGVQRVDVRQHACFQGCGDDLGNACGHCQKQKVQNRLLNAVSDIEVTLQALTSVNSGNKYTHQQLQDKLKMKGSHVAIPSCSSSPATRRRRCPDNTSPRRRAPRAPTRRRAGNAHGGGKR